MPPIDPSFLVNTGPGLMLLGLLLAGVFWIANDRGLPKGASTALAIGSVGTFVLGLGLTAGLGNIGVQPGTVGSGSATFAVTAAAGDPQNTSNVVFDQTAHTIQVQVQCTSSCASFSYGSGTVELNFTVGRSDAGTQDAIAELRVNTIGLVPKSDGSGTTYPIAAQYADSTYKTDWEKGPNASPVTINKFTTVLVAGGGSSYARLNITYNINAVAQQNAYGTSPITVTVAGQVWTITEILTIKV